MGGSKPDDAPEASGPGHLAPGTQLELEIGDLAFGGAGVAREEGFVVLVDQAWPGERVRVEITAVSKRFARARRLELLRAAKGRIDPPCRHDAVCGGCAYQALEYPAQLQAKQNQVKQVLERIGRFASPIVADPVPAPHPLGYRRRMRYAIPIREGTGPGLHARGNPSEIIEVPHCRLAEDRVQVLYGRLLQDLRSLSPSQRPHQMEIQSGSLSRSLIVVFNGEGPPSAGLRRLASWWCREAILQGVFYVREVRSRRRSHRERPLLLAGADGVEEALSGFRLRIPAGSFFQANPPLAAGIFQGIADHVADSASIAELYTGVGALTLFLARKGRPLTCVEGNAASLRAARNNASWNHLEGIEWVSAEVLEVMQGWSRRGRGFHSVVLDPPRQGLPAGATELLAKLAERKIVYLSCDPSTLARDLRDLVRSDGWKLERVVPVDFFPQTAAIECVAYLGKG